jgi:hypothetical protein
LIEKWNYYFDTLYVLHVYKKARKKKVMWLKGEEQKGVGKGASDVVR